MLRILLEQKIGKLSNEEFKAVLEMTTEDIKFNNIGFNKRTSLDYVLDIAVRSASVFRRCA